MGIPTGARAPRARGRALRRPVCPRRARHRDPGLDVAAGRARRSGIAKTVGRRRPTAVFCANDLLALGVLQDMTARTGQRSRRPRDRRLRRHRLRSGRRRAARLGAPTAHHSARPRPRCCWRRPDRGAHSTARSCSSRSWSCASRRPQRNRQAQPASKRLVRHEDRLFVTCLVDGLFPDVGKATVAAAGTARPRGRVPGGADLLRSDARQHRLPARGPAAGPPPRRDLRRLRGGRRAVRVVRRVGPPPARDGGRRSATRPSPPRGAAGRHGPTSCPSSSSTCSASTTSARTTRTG